MACDELHEAVHEMRLENSVQCWMNIAHQTIDALKGKSASSSLNRSRSTPIPTQSQHINHLYAYTLWYYCANVDAISLYNCQIRLHWDDIAVVDPLCHRMGDH